MSKSMKTLVVASILMFGSAISSAAMAECSGSHQAKKGDTTAMETGGTSTPVTQGKS
ncbi:MAG: hypothetical protein P1V34_03810 [Alphaproteobacteria bacterium]|nr:hypothetical protein [Alphaproteobacteria bacterium]